MSTPFSSFAFPATGAPTSRTMPNRLGDIYNVKDFGAVGDNVTDDTTAIRAAFTAMYTTRGSVSGGTLFFPPGWYKVTSQIDISGGLYWTNSRIAGSGRGATTIIGDIPNGFIFFQSDTSNGPNEISNLRLYNASTWVGSGALCMGNSSALIENVYFTGMINALLTFNTFEVTFRNCTGSSGPDATTGYNGTVGICGQCPQIYGWRSTSPYMVGLGSSGSNGTIIHGVGIENCTVSILLGMGASWASSCTVSGNILTVGGTLGITQAPSFLLSAVLIGRGITLPTWGISVGDTSSGAITIIGDHSTDGALTGTGGLGTYRISASFTISTPIPILSFWADICAPVDVCSIETEACYYGLYNYNSGAGRISTCLFTGTPTECVDAFGVTGYTSHSGLYLGNASSLIIEGIHAKNNGYAGGININPMASLNSVAFMACVADKLADNVTTAIISNGSGGAGTILNVTVFTSGQAIGIGMPVTGAGITAGTVITGNHASDVTLTGTGQAGTYRVNNSQNISSETITVHTQADWVMPTATASKAGVSFIRCSGLTSTTSGLNTLGMTFTCLPGQAGADSNLQAIIGMEYTIIDSNTATWGATAAAGGSNNVAVRYNGTNWTVIGK